MNRSTLMVVVGVAAAIVLAGGGFVAGKTVATNEAAASPSARAGNGTGRQFGAGGASGQGRNAISGQIISVSNGTLAIQLGQDQGSRIVLVSPSTQVVKTVEQSIALTDLKPGDRVTVVGQENADGSVNAQTIVSGGNALQNLFGGGGARPSASPTR